MGQNLFKLFSNDPVDYNLKQVRSQLGMQLITHIRVREWSDQLAANEMHVDAADVNRLMQGQLEDFNIDTLMTMLVRAGYTLDCEFNPGQMETQLRVTPEEV